MLYSSALDTIDGFESSTNSAKLIDLGNGVFELRARNKMKARFAGFYAPPKWAPFLRSRFHVDRPPPGVPGVVDGRIGSVRFYGPGS